jgi:CheY-like chemotaxis protein
MGVEKQIRIETSLDPAVDEVTIDAGRLKQILYNYLSNALKFTGPGGRITVAVTPEGDSEFRLAVTDTGVGISKEDIGRLFVDFQQLDATPAKRHQGTGLGLALTKRLVEAQGGRVGTESAPGQGSTFFAVLPRIPQGDRTGKATILTIEDQRLERALLTRMLQKAGYLVETAASGEEALEKCRRWRFDAITLDLLLPDGPGWELLAKIREVPHHRNTPVIVVSMLGEKDLRRIPLKVQGYLSKPVASAVLLEALGRIGLQIRGVKEEDEQPTYSDRG